MPQSPTPPKYAPLVTFLTAQPASAPTVTLTLPEIEQLIGAPLPAGAFTKTWWMLTRDRDRQLRPWVMAGWRVAATSMRTVPSTVTFERVDAAPVAPSPA